MPEPVSCLGCGLRAMWLPLGASIDIYGCKESGHYALCPDCRNGLLIYLRLREVAEVKVMAILNEEK